jgi:hypothetical protein
VGVSTGLVGVCAGCLRVSKVCHAKRRVCKHGMDEVSMEFASMGMVRVSIECVWDTQRQGGEAVHQVARGGSPARQVSGNRERESCGSAHLHSLSAAEAASAQSSEIVHSCLPCIWHIVHMFLPCSGVQLCALHDGGA